MPDKSIVKTLDWSDQADAVTLTACSGSESPSALVRRSTSLVDRRVRDVEVQR